MSRLRIDSLNRKRRDGSNWLIRFSPGLNLLVGDRNTSKSTTLQIIDFCLGNDHNAERRFGRQLSAEYEAFELEVTVDGSTHRLSRRLHEQGQLTRTIIDDEIVDTAGFNEWIARKLDWGWPPPTIPKGVLLPEASEEIPLTFRATLRHLYRNASSWTSWADREFEYLRRAVLAQFLGIIEPLFQGSRVQITRYEMQRQALEVRRTELREFLDRVVRRVAEGFRESGQTGLDSLEPAITETEARIQALGNRRLALATQVRASPQFAVEDDVRLSSLNVRTDEASREVDELSQIVAEQQRLITTLDGDIARFDRALTAGRLLEHFDVTVCPVCYQAVQPPVGDGVLAAVECYLCHQPLRAESVERRIDLERKTVWSERQELGTLTAELSERLGQRSRELEQLQTERRTLLSDIERRRRDMLSPLVTEFEEIQRELGRLEQQRESLGRLAGLRDQVTAIDAEILRIEQALEQLQVAAAIIDRERALIRDRCDGLATQMNIFSDALSGDAPLGGPVSIDPRDLTFYIGSGQWQYTLGDERKVLFFLAYHYGLLELASALDTPFPRLAILDNPFQQDVPVSQVEAALSLLAEHCARNESSQVIVTSRRPVPALDANRITFSRQFNAPS
jgi:hypothetical protein